MRDARRSPSAGEPSWQIVYYGTESGAVPVLEWITALSSREQALALGYIDQLQLLGLEARRPLVAPLEDKLYELRWKSENKQNRVAYFAATGRTFVLLHAIVKKQPRWSRRDLNIAKDRMQDYERRTRNEPRRG